MPNSTVPYVRNMTPAKAKGTQIDVHPIGEYVHADLRYLSWLRRPWGGRTLVALVGVQRAIICIVACATGGGLLLET
jgi:hypothetical protein